MGEPAVNKAEEYLSRSRAQYSDAPHAVILVLSNGDWIPGVRVESASFPLSIDALVNAVTTSVALDRTDIVAVASTRPFTVHDLAYVTGAFGTPDVTETSPGLLVVGASAVPDLRAEVPPFVGVPDLEPAHLVEATRHVSNRAFIPESRFPVGCLIPQDGSHAVPGVNVEHPNWTNILCAERNALGTIISYGLPVPRAILVSCPLDAHGTPCGACRQVIAELAPEASVWMDRGKRPPECVEALSLLPDFFSGQNLPRRHES